MLKEEGLVGRAAALGDKQKLVGLAIDRLDLDLCRQVGASIDLFEHTERGDLGIAQVVIPIALEDPARERLGIAATGPYLLPLFGHNDGGAGVLAAG